MRLSIFVIFSCGLLAPAGPTTAIQPPPAPPGTIQSVPAAAETVQPAPAPPEAVRPVVNLDQLVALGKSIAAIRYDSDNAFVYAARADALRATAKALEGGQIEFVANVTRVRETEVLIEVEPAGKTRLVLMHAAEPTFGNLRTVDYPGIASTRRMHKFSAPVGLRIGLEITSDVAKTLRHRDTLVLRGTLKALPVRIESVFAPDAVALISDWRVVDVNPQPGY